MTNNNQLKKFTDGNTLYLQQLISVLHGYWSQMQLRKEHSANFVSFSSITISMAMLSVLVLICINSIIFTYAQSDVNDTLQSNKQKDAASLIINTNPPSPAVKVLIDGKLYSSGSDGKIMFNGNIGQHKIEVPIAHDPGQRAADSPSINSSFLTFAGWEPPMPKNFSLKLYPQTSTVIELKLIRNVPISFEFFDASSNTIDKPKIGKVLLASTDGKQAEVIFPFKAFLEEYYFKKNQQVREDKDALIVSSPQIQTIPQKYKIVKVMMNDTNVIDKSKQTEFFPQNSSTINVDTKVYPLKIRITDRLFDTPVSAGISIHPIDDTSKMSNTTKTSLHFQTKGGETTISQLPKSTYIIKTDKGTGFGGNTAVLLTKPQEVTINILTNKSAAILGLPSFILFIFILFVLPKASRHLMAKFHNTNNKDLKKMQKKLKRLLEDTKPF